MSSDFKFVAVPSMPITVARIALGNAVAEDCCSVERPKVDSQHRQSSQSSNGGNLARRRYQNGSLFLRGKNPVWVGRWLEDVMDVRGKITRLHKSEVIGTKAEFPSRRLARRELDIRLSRINSLTYRAQKIISFADLAERWKRSVMSNYKPSSQSGMKSTVNRWLTPRFGHLMVNEITTEMLQQFLSDAEVKPKTVRNLYITFKLIWGTAKAWGYAEKNICEGIVLPTMNDPIRKWFNPEQMKQIIVAAHEPYKTMFWVDAECGIRGGELCALGIDDLDLDNRTISVKRSVYKGKLQTTKTRKGVRTFAISAELCEHLQGFLLHGWRDNPEKLLFATREGTPYDNRDIVDQVLHPLLDRLQIPRAGLHAFRHGNETLMDHLGIPMGVRRDRLGHEKNETTMGYTHVIGDDDRKTASKLGKILCPNLLNSQPVDAVIT
jgi:integrase